MRSFVCLLGETRATNGGRFDVKIVLLMNDSVVQPVGDSKIAVVV